MSGYGTCSSALSRAIKKTLIASEQDCPDVARRRRQWRARQASNDPGRLVFIDETWTKTNMAPLRGWCQRGFRLNDKVPRGRWQTQSFLPALRHDRITASLPLDGPINFVEGVLLPTLKSGDIVAAVAVRSAELSEYGSRMLTLRTAQSKLIAGPELIVFEPDETLASSFLLLTTHSNMIRNVLTFQRA